MAEYESIVIETNGDQSQTLAQTVEAANAWCAEHHVVPLSGLAGEAITVRNARYYQSLGLLDRTGSARGYGEKHLLQLIAIRVLQAKGLPLARIQSLLYQRTLEDLRELRERAREEALPAAWANSRNGQWHLHSINPDVLVISRISRELTDTERARIAAIFAPSAQRDQQTSIP